MEEPAAAHETSEVCNELAVKEAVSDLETHESSAAAAAPLDPSNSEGVLDVPEDEAAIPRPVLLQRAKVVSPSEQNSLAKKNGKGKKTKKKKNDSDSAESGEEAEDAHNEDEPEDAAPKKSAKAKATAKAEAAKKQQPKQKQKRKL